MKGFTLVECLSVSDAPTDLQRILSDRKARVQRETDPLQEWIACPGGCGGEAKLETPLTVVREGVTSVIRMAECTSGCKAECRNGYPRKPKFTSARFELPWNSGCEDELFPSKVVALKEDVVVSDDDGVVQEEVLEISRERLAELLLRALSQAKMTQSEAGARMGCSQSSVSKMLRGSPVASSTAEAALGWAESVLHRKVSPVESAEESLELEPTVEEGLTLGLSAVAPLNTEPPGKLNGQGAFQRKPTPYEVILRRMLEDVAQERLEEIAGAAAQGIVARVILEWKEDDSSFE